MIVLDYTTSTLTPDDVRAMRNTEYLYTSTLELIQVLDDMSLSTEEKRERLLEINARATPEAFDLEYALKARHNAIRRNNHSVALLWDKEVSRLKGEI